MRPRILILGRTGQVGWELCRVLSPMGDVAAADYPDVDLTREQDILDCVRSVAPQVIINAAAYTAVDKAESDPERARAINSVAPEILGAEAARLGALLVHYSTDYVFDGSKESGYAEDDLPKPLSEYGSTKLAGDQAVIRSGCKHLIFRLCWVYGARGQNFMRTIVRLAAEREQIRVVADQVGCPTWSRMIAEATGMALRQTLSESSPQGIYGVYHLAASGQASWHQFAQAIVDAMPAEKKRCSVVQPITTMEYPLPASRPAFSILNCSKLERVFDIRLPDWKKSLHEVLEP